MAVNAPGKESPLERLSRDTTINGIKFSKGRWIVYCHDLGRTSDDADRRTFVLDATVRAVEARMLRVVGVKLENTRAAPTETGALPIRGAAIAGLAGRELTLTEQAATDIIKNCDG